MAKAIEIKMPATEAPPWTPSAGAAFRLATWEGRLLVDREVVMVLDGPDDDDDDNDAAAAAAPDELLGPLVEEVGLAEVEKAVRDGI